MIPICSWCAAEGRTAHPDTLTLVAVIETGSGPGGSVHACPDHLDEQQLLPVEEQPPGTRGGIHYRTG